jgi:DNA primase
MTGVYETRTLAHELAHVLLHDGEELMSRPLKKLAAESAAYIVLGAAGLDSAEYSLPYVAHWAGGDRALISKTGERAMGAARQILDGLEATEKEQAA